MKRPELKHTMAPFQAMQAQVPEERIRHKRRFTVTGLIMILIGVAGQIWWHWPWYPTTLLALFGGHLVSGDFRNAALKSTVGILRDVHAAVTGGDDES